MTKIDNYSSFNYKNESYSTTAYSLSEDFDGFIINEGTDLTFFNPSNFSHEFMTPQFGMQSYFMGTTQENREFTFPILLKEVTLAEYKQFLRWLSPRNEGTLWFDYNTNWCYDVKVKSISEGKFTVNPNCDSTLNYNIELTVSFITKNDYAARLVTDITSTTLPTTITPKFLLDDGTYISTISTPSNAVFKIVNISSNDYRLDNFSNEDAYLKIIVLNGTSLIVSLFNGSTYDEIYNLASVSAVSATIYTEYGFAVDIDNNFISLGTTAASIIIPKTSYIMISFDSNNLSEVSIIPIVREVI